MIGKRTMNQRNVWVDLTFFNEIKELKRAKSYKEKKDYSNADITRMLAQHPVFKELKKQFLEEEQLNNFITGQIKIKMDGRRI